MALVAGFGPLEPFIGAEEGVALLDVRNKFWSNIYDGHFIYNIESRKPTKDEWCKYVVEQVGRNKVALKDRRGVYLSRIHRPPIDFTEAAKPNRDVYCEFEVFTKDAKVVFKADNGKFLSVIDRGNNSNVEAAKEGVDEYCEFIPVIGDIVSPAFTIISVDFKNPPSPIYKPTVVKIDTYTNNTSVNQKHTFTLTWTKTVSETTTWNHTWGLDQNLSFNISIFNISTTVSYSGSKGASSTTERTITMSEQTEVTIPPRTKVIAKLMVDQDENAIVPFTATVRKTKSNGEVVQFTEAGSWQGVLYESVGLTIEEEKL